MPPHSPPTVRRAGAAILMLIVISGDAWAGPPPDPASAASPASPAVVTAPADEAASAVCDGCAQPSPKDCRSLCVAHNPQIAVADDGTIAAPLRICNRSGAAVKAALQVSDFSRRGSSGLLLPLESSPGVTAVDAADQPVVAGKQEWVADGCIDVTLTASRLLQAGPLKATLAAGADKLLELVAIRYPMPFALKVDGPKPESVDIRFVKGEGQSIRLRNEDAAAYRFRWHLDLGGDPVASGVAFAGPQQRVVLPVSLKDDQFPWLETGFLRAGERHGQLVLEHEPDAAFRERPIESKVYPVMARLERWSAVWQGIWNTFWIVMVLIVGIGASLLVNYSLPIQRQRLAIKQSLADLEGRLTGLAGVIRSRRLSLLRTEKKRLRDELRRNGPFTAATEEALPKLRERVQALGQRIGLTAQAGEHLSALKDDTMIAMPEAEQVIALCRTALEVADKPMPTEAELNAARDALLSAAALRGAGDEPPNAEAAQKLRDEVSAVQTGSGPAAPQAQPLADLLDSLRRQLSALPPGDMTREVYTRASAAVWKAQSILEFAALIEASGSAAVRAQRLERVPHLLNALLPGPCESVRRADDIVREVEQNVSKAQLVDALKQRKTVRVEIDPPTPNGYQLVEFRVRLDEPGLDTALARQQIRCCWQVSGSAIGSRAVDLPDQSWTISHYFEPAGTAETLAYWWQRLRGLSSDSPAQSFKVEAGLFEDFSAASPLATGQAEVSVEPAKSYSADARRLSVGSTLVTVLLVSIGLLAGAQEKIQALDWWSALVAVLVIGFGADALKRVLMKP